MGLTAYFFIPEECKATHCMPLDLALNNVLFLMKIFAKIEVGRRRGVIADLQNRYCNLQVFRDS
jgi:hypothetical protein